MTTQSDKQDLDREKKALLAIRKLRQEIQQLEYRRNEPIAIVGLSCRFPRSPDVDAYWRLLDGGLDAVSDVPADRWDIDAYYDPDPDAPGKVYIRQAGYLDAIDEFDAAFFGISPREAEYMDPQQRLLLEQAWSALERAGIAPASLHGTRSGVFVGVSTNDYGMLIQNAEIDPGPYYITGNALSAAVGRMAYILRLQGPAMAIDTACSSSLVAVHQACASLRNGETDLALAGGVNLLISPTTMIASCRAHMLSPDAHCKTFDASADGYARGEGCGIVVLKRLGDALRDRDNIQAVIRGSAVNQDGHSSGLTVPNGPAQERVIADALRMAGVRGDEVQYLEAHGTGTPLGDPIELQAAAAVLAADRAGKPPLLVGSVKTNLGHLESAAGIAGLIKVVLSMQQDRIPRQLFFNKPNPHIPWENLNIRVAAQPESWPGAREGRIASVSSFGVSGTNAHLVLEQAPARPDTHTLSEPAHRLLALSGRTSGALAQIAADYDAWLEQHEKTRPGDLCYTANTGRNHFEHRAGLVFSSKQQLHEQLKALSSGGKARGLSVGELATAKKKPKLGFLFTGQGSQYSGMGRELYQGEKTFRECFDRCAAEFARLCPDAPGLAEVVFEEAHEDLLAQTDYIQPALYALQVSLAALWRDWGVVPDALIGHSAGEYAAACSSGVFGIEAGLRLIVERARLMQRLPAGGGMLTVTAPVEVIEAALTDDDSACVSAYHGMNTVISGPGERLDELMARFEKEERYCTRLPAPNAFHSKLVDPILDDFEAIAGGMEYQKPGGKLVSGMTGAVVDSLDAVYWRDQMREPVRFDSAVRSLFESSGCDVVVEIGPQAELMWLAQMCWRPEHDVFWTSSLEKGKDASAQMLSAAGQLYTRGAAIDFAGLEGESLEHRKKIALPTYPFQRERYWIELPESAQTVAGPRLKDCLFRSVWEPRDLESSVAQQAEAGSWLVFCDAGGMGKAVCEVLEARGERVVQVAANPGESGFEQALADAEVEGPVGKLLYLGCLDGSAIDSVEDLQRAQEIGVESVLRLAQVLIDRDWEGQLWLATRGVQRVLDSDRVEPTQSPLWGLGKVISMELPRSWGGLVDLPLGEDAAALAGELVAVCDCGDFEDLVALREGRRWVMRLLPEENLQRAQLELEAEASYLITGGLGGIGLKIAQRLVQRGAGSLVLTSRGAPSQAAETAIAELEEQGCHVSVIRADVSREEEVLRLFDEMNDLPLLKGIVHAAGIEAIVAIEEVSLEEHRSVMAAKVSGAWLLDRMTLERGIELSFFVCTSSIASVWGSLQQASYAAANAYLTALCEHRLAEGRAATAVCFGPWKEVGMGVAGDDDLEWLSSRGIRAMSPRFGLDGIEAIVTGGVTGTTLADMNWSTFRPVMEVMRPRPLLESLGRDEEEAESRALAESGSALAQQLIEAEPADQNKILKRAVRAEMSRIMKLPPDTLGDTTGFFELGMDSLMAVEFRNAMEKMLGQRLPATLVMDMPNIDAVTSFVLEEVLDLQEKREAEIGNVSIRQNEPIAVVGLSCRFPGAPDVDAFWKLLSNGMDAIGEVPLDRWDIDDYYSADRDVPGTMYTRNGGFLNDIDKFDARFFGISPREAVPMDPQHRMLLEQAWIALENASIPASDLTGSRTGVFVGITSADYAGLFSGNPNAMDAYFVTGNSFSTAAGRLSYVLGLQGPAMAIDTACSSSLVALHEAVNSLQQGESDLALSGGVSLMIDPANHAALCRGQFLAADGRSKSFDASGDGYGRGEGCGFVVLKRLSDAERDRDRVMAVIRGIAVNQDGRSSGLTVPNGPAQERVIKEAMARAGVSPGQVAYLEAHGTGTPLGDPIEVQAAAAALGAERPPDAPLLLGSVKSNIGHLEGAAGVASLIKLVLSLHHEQIPGSLHFETPNPHIPWEDLPIEVVSEGRPWPRGERPRIAGVSSFGMSGTNVHVVVEEGITSADLAGGEQDVAGNHYLLALSAQNEAGLRDLAAGYAAFIADVDDLDLANVCHTANTGRTHLDERAGLVTDSRETLLQQLEALSRGESAPGVKTGRVRTPEQSSGIAFLFTGQGSQYSGMGRELYQGEKTYRECFDRCAAEFARLCPDAPGLAEVVFEEAHEDLLAQTDYIQPALYALQMSLVALWRDWGVVPDALIGHSAGEYAAACSSGVFGIEAGLRLIVERARLMQRLPAGGGMLTVTAPVEVIEAALTDDDSACVSAYHGMNTVISGPGERLDELMARFEKEGRYCTRLPAPNAFHSKLVDPILDDFEAIAGGMEYQKPGGKLVSGMTGAVVDSLDAVYWRDQMREPVRFDSAVRSLFESSGCDVVVEIGPQAELMWLAQMCWRPEHDVFWTSSLEKGKDASAQMLSAAGQLYTRGAAIDFAGMEGESLEHRKKIALPTYPFQRERYWIELPESAQMVAGPRLKDCLFRSVWEPRDLESSGAQQAEAGSWLVFCDAGGMGKAVCEVLEARGERVVQVAANPGESGFEQALADAEVEGPVGKLLYLGCLDGSAIDSVEDLQRAQEIGVESVLRLAQVLIDRDWEGQLWLATRGVQRVLDSDRVEPTQSPLWGLGKVISMELPRSWGGLVDLPLGEDAAALAGELVAVCDCGDFEDLVALREGRRWVMRLLPEENLQRAQLELEAEASYLITGGLGGIGLKIAQRLVQRGAGSLVLTSRGAPSQAAETAIAELEEQGCHVSVIRADVSREEEVLRLFDEMNDLPLLKGIVHAAGIEAIVAIEEVSLEEHRSVMAAKVSGAWLLDRMTQERGIELSFFVCTSSIASVWGSLQQASYAAANAYLTALCEHRLAEGRAATALCFGPWKEVGMGASSEAELEWLRSRGIRAMSPRFGLDGIEAIVTGGVTGTTLADMNWSTFRPVMEVMRPRPLLESLGRDEEEAESRALAESGSALAQQLIEADPADQPGILKNALRVEISQVIQLPAEELGDTTGFFELGMDSLMAVEFRNRMEKMLGRRLPVSMVMDMPNIDAIAGFVLEEVLDLEEKAEVGVGTVSIQGNEPIAVLWPASIGQKRLWFLQQMAPDSPQFNLPMAVRFEKGLGADLAERILGELVRRHSALRTTTENKNGELVQVVQRWTMPDLQLVDLANDVDPQDRLTSIQQEEARTPIDIMGDSLTRFTLVNLSANDQVLLITMHHAISDGVSNGVLLREFVALYDAFTRQEQSPLAQPKVQFVDYALYESRQLLKYSTDDSVAYWKKELRGIPSLELPSDRARPAVQTHVGDSVPVDLPVDTQDELYACSQNAGVTPFVTLLSAWSLLLSRYSRQQDFGVGTPVAGREGPEWSDAIGFFINMLTLRVQLDPDWTVRELLAQVDAVNKRAYEHQALPFDWLVEHLNPARDPGRTPLFQAALILQVPIREFQERLDSEGIAITDLRPMLGTSQYDLTLDLTVKNTGIWGFLEYNTDLFDRWRIEQMVEHFKILLTAMIRQPDAPVSGLSLSDSDERQYLLTQWNRTSRDYPLDQCVHERIAEQVRQRPDEFAVVCGDSHLTYADLNRRANQLAHYLRGRGVGPETLVGLCVDRSIDMVVAVLGVMKAGGAYVPLDPDFPKQRLELMLEDADVKILLSQTQLLDRLPESNAETICLDREADRIAGEPSHDPERCAGPDNAVYVIYTSGSTGKPKGVVITHRSLMNFLFSMAEELAFDSGEILLAVTTLSFDISKLEILLPLLRGARVVIATREETKDANLLRKVLVHSKATTMQATPATWRMLLASGWNRSEAVRVLCGGEALSRELAENLLEVTDSLWNVYGPTETTIWSAIRQVREVHRPTVAIGHPLANTQLYVLDGGLNPTPVGVPGELFIAGDGLARGYLNQPELTRERFVADPFAENSNARLYRTGDLCSRLPDGNIEFMGRLDNQVKLRGFRVEIGDIEDALSACEGIEQAAVTTWKGPDGFEVLAGYLVADCERRPGVDEIKASLRESLPGYMVPGMLMYLDELPLTPNRKVDRRALPSPDLLRESAQAEFVAPRTEKEAALANIWKEVLKLETVGVRDKFFDLGGHSLQIVEIISRLKKRFGIEIPVVDLFRYETIEALAKYLEQAAGSSTRDEQSGEPTADASAESIVVEAPQYRTMDGRVYTYRRYCEKDRASALASYAKSFSQTNADVLDAALEWKYLESNSMPGDGSSLDVLECDGDIVGMNGGVSARFKINGSTIPGYWGSDFHVAPDHRVVAAWVWSEIARHSSGLKLSVPGVDLYPILSEAESSMDIDRYVTLVACLDLGAVLKTRGWPSAFSSICGLLYRPLPVIFDRYTRGRSAVGIEVVEVSRFDERFDRFWELVSDDYPAIMVRDQAFLSWRFDRCPIRDYNRYAAVREGEILGYAVTRNYSSEGTERGMIVDFLVRRQDTAVLSALIRAAMRDFRSRGAVSVRCSLSSSQQEHIRQFRSHGFLVQRPGSHIVADRGQYDKSLAAAGEWFITYADGDLDY